MIPFLECILILENSHPFVKRWHGKPIGNHLFRFKYSGSRNANICINKGDGARHGTPHSIKSDSIIGSAHSF